MADANTEDFAKVFANICIEEDQAQKLGELEMKKDYAQDPTDCCMDMDSVRESADLNMEDNDLYEAATKRTSTPSIQRSKKRTKTNMPDRPFILPYRESIPIWSIQPNGQPRTFDFDIPALSLDFGRDPSPVPEPPRKRGKKRNSDGVVKDMIAELNARAELAISRETSPSPPPRGRRPGRASPRPIYWRWDTLGLSPMAVRSSPMSPKRTMRRNKPPANSDSRSIEEQQHGEGTGTPQRKRKGSLLEWRNKEMFEEPLRI